MKKFDLKKAILENKATFFSSLNEGYMGQFYAPEYLERKYGKEMASKIEAKIDEMDPNSWDRFTGMESAKEVEDYIADIKDMLGIKDNLDESLLGITMAAITSELEKKLGRKPKSEEVEKEFNEMIKKYKSGEKNLKESSKMKKSELKAKIKEMILAEMNLDVTDETSGYDFLAELEDILEAEEKEADAEEEIDITDEFSTEEPQTKGGINVNQNADADLTGVEKETQDNLEAALEAAKKLGDEKLATQIGNTLTFFTKQHVVK